MIRKALIVMLSLAAVVVTAVDISSYLDWPGRWRYQHAPSGVWIRHHVTRAWTIGGLSRYRYGLLEVAKVQLYGPVRVPLWGAVALLAAYPIYAMVREDRTRRERKRRGFCVHCDYDLTGNESGVCPECGEKIARHGQEGRRRLR